MLDLDCILYENPTDNDSLIVTLIAYHPMCRDMLDLVSSNLEK